MSGLHLAFQPFKIRMSVHCDDCNTDDKIICDSVHKLCLEYSISSKHLYFVKSVKNQENCRTFNLICVSRHILKSWLKDFTNNNLYITFDKSLSQNTVLMVNYDDEILPIPENAIEIDKAWLSHIVI